MIHTERITSDKHVLFPFCWELYCSAFPKEERRPLDYHIEVMQRKQFFLNAIVNDDQVAVGFIAWWDLQRFRYIEHFATAPSVRGGGFGSKALSEFVGSNDKPVLLEVELPTTPISQRRIEFYKRMGFVMNDYDYFQPSYRVRNGGQLQLLVMTYPRAISQEELQNFVDENFPIIHFRHFG